MEKKQKLSKEELKRRQRISGQTIGRNNLIPLSERTPQEQLAIRKKGQAAQAEAIKKKKAIRDICNDLLSISASDMAKGVLNEEIAQKLENAPIELTLYDLIVAKQAEIALLGNTKAAEFIRTSAGDSKQEAEIDINITTDNDRALLANLSNRIEALEAIPTDTTSV